MASYKQVEQANHKDAQTFVLGASLVGESVVPGLKTESALSSHASTIAPSTWTDATTPWPSLATPSAAPTVSPSTPTTKAELMYASRSEPSGVSKIIIGSVCAISMIFVLATFSYLCLYHGRAINRRRRRARALTLTPPHSPVWAQGSEQETKLEKDVASGWVQIDYRRGSDSPRTSADSGLGVMMNEKTTAPDADTSWTSTRQEAVDGSDAAHKQAYGCPGGPLSSNPPDDLAFPPLERIQRRRSSETPNNETGQTPEPPSMPIMGDGALTSRASKESMIVVLEMRPTKPKHREMTPKKSILKKSSPPPPLILTQLPPAPVVADTVDVHEDGSKQSLFRKALAGLTRPKKEPKIVLPAEAEAPVPKPKKEVKFGEDTVRRVSQSPETDEGDWQTIDSKSEASGGGK